MALWLKQSTAATVKLGPFVDETDGVTAETGLTISQADIRLSKNGGDIAQSNNAAGATHDELGYYDVPLDTTDTNTLGRLFVAVSEAGALPVWQEFMVVPANVWDSMFGSDKLEVDITQIGGDTQSATDLKDFADSGYDPGTNKVQGVVLVDTTTTNTDMRGTDNALLAANYTAPDNASITAILEDTGTTLPATLATIEGQTDDIGVAGAGLTALGDTRIANLDATISSRGTADPGDAMTLTTGERDAIAAALLDLANGVETSETVRQSLRLIRAVLLGKSDGFPAGPAHFRDRADSKDRVTATVDADGNRTAITIDAS